MLGEYSLGNSLKEIVGWTILFLYLYTDFNSVAPATKLSVSELMTYRPRGPCSCMLSQPPQLVTLLPYAAFLFLFTGCLSSPFFPLDCSVFLNKLVSFTIVPVLQHVPNRPVVFAYSFSQPPWYFCYWIYTVLCVSYSVSLRLSIPTVITNTVLIYFKTCFLLPSPAQFYIFKASLYVTLLLGSGAGWVFV